VSFSAIRRAKLSAMLPGDTGTTIRTTWLGYCAVSGCAAAGSIAIAKTMSPIHALMIDLIALT
jgi:hypothetical protein